MVSSWGVFVERMIRLTPQSSGNPSPVGEKPCGLDMRGMRRRIAGRLAPSLNPEVCSDRCRYRHRDRLRYKANPEGERAKSRRYYRANRERVIARVTARKRKAGI